MHSVLDIKSLDDMEKLLPHTKSEKQYHIGMIIKVHNKMQNNYSYKLTAPIGQNFDSEFKPKYTPKEMLDKGVFEGKYCNDQILEFPKEWFEEAIKNNKLSPERPNIQMNYFKVKSRQSLSIWKRNGWIYGDDPRGWFEWYMRYYLGRRDSSIDKIQIRRWKHNIAHLGALKKQCPNLNDDKCGLVRKQLLLQWSYPMK
jgi:hypothetical protein